MLTYLRMLLSDTRTFKTAMDIGLQHLGWNRRKATGPLPGVERDRRTARQPA